MIRWPTALFFVLGLVADVRLAGAQLTEVDAAPLDASRCWPACIACERRCEKKTGSEKNDCRESCWDASATCCEANGKNGVFKMCGCQ